MSHLTRRELALASAAFTLIWAGRTESATAAEPAAPATGDPFAHVDPELRPRLEQLAKMMPQREWSAEMLPALRQPNPAFAGSPLAEPAYVERKVPGAKGDPDVRVYVIGAKAGGTPRPAVLHIHGGGYVVGSALQSVRPMQELAKTHDCVVVTVDYRLAPETKFPGSLEDNYAALRWLHAQADELGVDRARIALLGESAGGGHAAALAIAARDRAEVPIALEVLIYPMLDDRTGSTRSVAPHMGAFIWTPQANRFGWSSLLGMPAGSESAPRGAVPSRVENLAGLPPTFIGTGGIDLFVEENIAYAQRLLEAGVPTELYIAPGAFHGFDLIVPEASISKSSSRPGGRACARAEGRESWIRSTGIGTIHRRRSPARRPASATASSAASRALAHQERPVGLDALAAGRLSELVEEKGVSARPRTPVASAAACAAASARS